MNHSFLYYYPRKNTLDWGYTPGRLSNFDSINRFISGRADYWEKDARLTEQKKCTLVLCDWALTAYNPQELGRCIEVLRILLENLKFEIWAPEAGDVVKLTPKNIKEKLLDPDFCRGLVVDDRDDLEKKLSLHEVNKDSIRFLDYFKCQQLFFNDKENRVHSLHVERSPMEIDEIVSSMRQSVLTKPPIAVKNGFNLVHKKFEQLASKIPGMVEEEHQIRIASINSNVAAETLLNTMTPDQFQFLEEIFFYGTRESLTLVARILAQSPNLKKISLIKMKNDEWEIQPALFEKINLDKLEELHCEDSTLHFLGQLLSKAPNIKNVRLMKCIISGPGSNRS